MLQLLELLVVDLTDEAEHLRGERRIVQLGAGIGAHPELGDADAREILLAFENREPLVLAHIERDDRRLQRRLPFAVVRCLRACRR